jgi:hypothetical protein
MATRVYEEYPIILFDGTEIFVSPLKIKYLDQLMEAFNAVHKANDDFESIAIMVECTRIAMKQFYPEISKTTDQIEDNFDLPTIYKILDYAAGIKINEANDEPVKDQAEQSGQTWADLDLVKLETEVFLLGAWKNYEELEISMSMPELLKTISMKRELDHVEKKFLAAMQGVDLDKESGNGNEWEDLKARVFSKGKVTDGNDILALQGLNAEKAGFGIGMGLDYEVYD